MRLFLRVLLLLAMLRVATQALVGYAFDFHEHGYPLWPLLVLGVCFWGYIQLRPRYSTTHHTLIYSGTANDTILLLVLSLACSAFVLDKRGEPAPLTPLYFLHISTLTLFLLLVPFIVGYACEKARSFVTALSALVLMAVLLDGTFRKPEPVIQLLEQASAYTPDSGPSVSDLQPMEILPPTPPVVHRRKVEK